MRHGYSSITPAVVHQQARGALQVCLDWQPYNESVSVEDLLSLLLFMVSKCASLYDTARRFFKSRFSHTTASKAVKAQLPTKERLIAGLLDALHSVASFSRLERRRSWTVAIDTHNVCYYGKHTKDLIGGQKKQGTQWFFSYATAVLIHKHHRYTIALCPVSPGQKPHEIVRTLLDQIVKKGLKIGGVVLDSGFDSGETLLLLQERSLAYTVPLRRKGRGSNQRNRCFEGAHNSIRWTEWRTEKTRRLVKTRVLLWKGSRRTMAFAFHGWSGNKAKNIHQVAERQRRQYRQRFGIETSYRQKNQAKAKTTSRDPVYRLLLEGLAYLLRQVWVALTAQLALCKHAKPNAWIAALTLLTLLDWLADELKTQYPDDRSIPLEATS